MMALSDIGVSTTRPGPNSLYRPFGNTEHAAGASWGFVVPPHAAGYILPDEKDTGIALHFLPQGLVDRFPKSLDSHAFPSISGVDVGQ
jgi:hypothetical protein